MPNKYKEVTLRLTAEEYRRLDAARADRGVKFQGILYAGMEWWLSGGAHATDVKIPEPPALGLSSDDLALIKSAVSDIAEIIGRLEVDRRAPEAAEHGRSEGHQARSSPPTASGRGRTHLQKAK